MKNKIIIFNPYKILDLSKLFWYRSILSRNYGKGFFLKKILNDELFYKMGIRYIKNNFKKFNKINVALFNHVEIETINRCNNICGFCPVSKSQDIRSYLTMTDSLFKKIIDELSNINYSGEIAFHSNNEPLLDKELSKKILYARENCPNSYLYFYTNGTLLNSVKVLEFKKSGINKIVVNNYNSKMKLNKNIVKMVEELKQNQTSNYPQIVIIIRDPNEMLNNRAGDAPNKKKNLYYYFKYFQDSPCNLPFKDLIIRPDGKISLCCQDAYGKITLGDINESSLTNIWYGEPFKEIRKNLTQIGRKGNPLCNTCDSTKT